jgi:hypothetical protein
VVSLEASKILYWETLVLLISGILKGFPSNDRWFLHLDSHFFHLKMIPRIIHACVGLWNNCNELDVPIFNSSPLAQIATSIFVCDELINLLSTRLNVQLHKWGGMDVGRNGVKFKLALHIYQEDVTLLLLKLNFLFLNGNWVW